MHNTKSMEFGRMKGFSAKTFLMLLATALLVSPISADMGVDTGEHIVVGEEQWDGASSDKIAPGAFDSIDEPADEECFTWEDGSSKGEWQECGGITGIVSCSVLGTDAAGIVICMDVIDYLLLEGGDKVLLENGDKIYIESGT